MSSKITWPVPDPAAPPEAHPALVSAALSAARAYGEARAEHTRGELAESSRTGADGTATMRVDELVEGAIADTARRHRVNLLSEEVGFVDNASALTMVVDPVDGSNNAASGVPLSCFAGVMVEDGVPTEALTCWLDTGRCWHAIVGEDTAYRTSGRTELDGAALGLLRPHPEIGRSWWHLAERAERVRVLGTTCLEAALVAEGSFDAFVDPGNDAHRIVDLAAALVMVPAAGGVVRDVFDRPLEIDTDLTRRWSGVVAATPELAERIIETVRG
ncbi:inositol monophosphatase family protein [Salinactinospora qingdaonensis]|uniref:inositol-phosphate phosphatase n=1 Tax=Salinactinospora qingdaonensis TaxID=702744 RepID=A0ABP7FMQ3_9ACTN